MKVLKRCVVKHVGFIQTLFVNEGAEEDIWTEEGSADGRMDKIA
jgi:hypothetical protein